MNKLWIVINTGFNGHPDSKTVEITYERDGKMVRGIRIPFESLEKFPLNNSPVFKVGVSIQDVNFEALIQMLKESEKIGE